MTLVGVAGKSFNNLLERFVMRLVLIFGALTLASSSLIFSTTASAKNGHMQRIINSKAIVSLKFFAWEVEFLAGVMKLGNAITNLENHVSQDNAADEKTMRLLQEDVRQSFAAVQETTQKILKEAEKLPGFDVPRSEIEQILDEVNLELSSLLNE